MWTWGPGYPDGPIDAFIFVQNRPAMLKAVHHAVSPYASAPYQEVGKIYAKVRDMVLFVIDAPDDR